MAYAYDLFLSYKHSDDWKPWVFQTFLPLLRWSVETELGREIRMFEDVKEISATETDQAKLESQIGRGLGRSRCMIAIWNVMYFRSRWCWCECRSFVKRMDKHPNWSPIYPVVVFNGDRFPEFARSIQWLDLRAFAVPNMRKESPQHEALAETIAKAARELASAIEQSPQWRPEWLSQNWFDDEPPPEDDLSFPVLPRKA